MPRPFMPLTAYREHILNQVKGQNILKWPKPMRMPADKRDDKLYCHLRIGSTLEPTIRDQLITFLRSNADVFAWSAADMPGIDPSWTAECQVSFETLKEYLASPPLLSKPIAGEMLFLYLAVTNFAVNAVLVREQDSKQFPIYYVSKVLQGAELHYPITEKLAFALLIAARKLRPYFQSHTITVFTDKPLRRKLHKPDLSGRLVLWSVELGEFNIQYKPRPSIKGQALADFIVKCTLPIDENESHVDQPEVFAWTLYVDGSSNTKGSGAGLILKGPDGLICFASIPKQAPNPLTMMKSPIPFTMCGMDLLGPFPPASAQHKFVIVAIDYFTKWVEAEALATITAKKCEDFFWRAVIYRFGIPCVLITDNGKQFDNTTFRTFCANLTIAHRFTSVAHPETNKQTEVTNRTLLQGLKKKLGGAKGLWVEELPKIIWAYHTTTRTATGETPFSLAFGTEALIPLEIGLPSVRLITYNPDTNDRLRGNLDLLDKKRDQSAMRLATYQHRVAKFFDKRVQSRVFRVGDLVLRRMDVSVPRDTIGKLSPNWEGPYRVIKLGGPRVLSFGNFGWQSNSQNVECQVSRGSPASISMCRGTVTTVEAAPDIPRLRLVKGLGWYGREQSAANSFSIVERAIDC
ncbi:hypothetical protein RJ639_007839 [Escallonia herrerae]|uniref:Integrase catalytic domain-containing protein n=1 Tax=Escallonia herrerae TaxID=1293975 RepID=A0AA89AWQ5_9ASTE|nr:hypothetical protein RJ639_007839 [Escallonia herrerae]